MEVKTNLDLQQSQECVGAVGEAAMTNLFPHDPQVPNWTQHWEKIRSECISPSKSRGLMSQWALHKPMGVNNSAASKDKGDN